MTGFPECRRDLQALFSVFGGPRDDWVSQCLNAFGNYVWWTIEFGIEISAFRYSGDGGVVGMAVVVFVVLL